MVDRGRAGGIVSLVDRELSRYNRDQAGPRMRVPPTVSPDWPRVSDDIDVGVPFHLRLEIPPILVKLVAHQVQRAIRKVGQRQRWAGKPACGSCAGRRDADGEHKCDEQWQNRYLFEVSSWIHGFSFLDFELLVDGSEGVPEVVVRDVAAEDNAGDTREAVVQTRPDSGVDDLAPELAGRFKVDHRIQISGRPGGVEAMDVEVNLIGAE